MNEPINEPLVKNEHVKELLSIMAENGKDASGLTALLDYVTSMESHLNKAFGELQYMQRELSGLREERDHPVRTLLQSLETRINEASKSLNELKLKIIDGCKLHFVLLITLFRTITGILLTEIS